MNKRILVIDDDEDILELWEIILGEEGFQLELRKTGPTTQEVYLLHPDLILLDVRINGFPKTGVEICSELKSDASVANIPVLLVSAEHNLELLASCCHADGFVNKPFDIDVVLKKVREFVS